MQEIRSGLLGRTWAFILDNSRLALRRYHEFLSDTIALALGLGLAVLVAILVVKEEWVFILPLVVGIPAAIAFLRKPFVAVGIWLLVFPLVVETPAGTRELQWLLHRAMLPGALVLVVVSRSLRLPGWRPLRLGLAEISMLLYLLLSASNILLMSQSPNQMLIHYFDRIVVPFCMYGLIRALEPDKEDLKWLVRVALIALFLQLFIGLLSWTVPGVLPNAWLGRVGARTIGSLGIPGVFTTTVLFLALLLLQHGLGSRSHIIQLGTALIFAAAMTAVFFSFSRGSWLGGLVVIAGLGFLYPRVMGRLALVLGLAAILLGGTIFADEFLFAWDRLTTERTAGARIVGNAAAVKLIEQKPLFGWGYGNYELHDEQFRERIWDLPVRKQHTSHHTYLLLASEMGLVGLFLYLLPAGWWLFKSLKVWNQLPREGFGGRSWLAMLWLVLASHFIIGNFTDMIFSYYFSTTMWWMVLGLIATLASRDLGMEQHASVFQPARGPTGAT